MSYTLNYLLIKKVIFKICDIYLKSHNDTFGKDTFPISNNDQGITK
jgi:hypothetical protein